MTKSRALLIALALIAAAVLWYNFAPSTAPAGQPPLASMDLASLKGAFNRAVDQTRILVLLSPT